MSRGCSLLPGIVGVSRTTVYAIKKRMDDGEGVNRRAGSGRKTVVTRVSLRAGCNSKQSLDFLRSSFCMLHIIARYSGTTQLIIFAEI